MPDPDTRTTYDSWVARCPLRKWRHEQALTILQLAVLMDVSITTIQAWERGVHLPTGPNLVRATEVVGLPVMTKWQRWQARKPGSAAA